jgi:hypothetical protein
MKHFQLVNLLLNMLVNYYQWPKQKKRRTRHTFIIFSSALWNAGKLRLLILLSFLRNFLRYFCRM